MLLCPNVRQRLSIANSLQLNLQPHTSITPGQSDNLCQCLHVTALVMNTIRNLAEQVLMAVQSATWLPSIIYLMIGSRPTRWWHPSLLPG